jgi:hypothetical protein
MSSARFNTAFAIAIALGSLWAKAALAEPDLDRARDAYDRGVRAHAAGNYGVAAKAFSEADALAPTTASLEAALDAAIRADDATLGAELLERSNDRAERDAPLLKFIDAARKRFGGRTGTILANCKPPDGCLIAVDGRPADALRPVYALVGTHTVVVQRGDHRVERLVQVRPDAVTLVPGPEPASVSALAASSSTSTSSRRSPSRGGVAPAWFFISLGATAALGGASMLSGLDAVNKHDDFRAAGCAPGATGPRDASCDGRSDEGASATLRTNLLIGVTALLAINTAVLGAVFVRWSSQPSGGVATLGGAF